MLGILQTSKLNTSCVPNNCGYKISVDKDVMVQPGSASARGPHMLHGWSRLTYAPWLDHEKGKPWWIFQRHGSCGVYFAQKIHVLAPRRKIHGWEILYIDGRNVYIGKTPSALGSSNDESLTSLKRCFFSSVAEKVGSCAPHDGKKGSTRELGSSFSILNIFWSQSNNKLEA